MDRTITGGCLCGQLRYRAVRGPQYCGYCCCADCRKASGSGYIPFMGFAGADLTVSGTPAQVRTLAYSGGEAVRNFCRDCGSLVFGGIIGEDESHTIYAGSLNDPSEFRPTLAIFVRNKPDWVALPPGLRLFETMPEG